MRSPIFTGTCTALVTPFDDNGTVDYYTFDSLLERQIEGGIDAVCVCGTTGESATLSSQEQTALVERCVKRTHGRVKVIAGAGCNNTANALNLSHHAEDAGADALLHVSPYYNKATQAGLILHYEYIASRITLPIILYNVPARTGVSFTAETYKTLSDIPTINGVKEASGDLSLVAHTRHLCGDDFTIWSGNDDQIVPMMSLGAKGVISVASNLMPAQMVQLSHLCLEEQFVQAAQIQLDYTDMIDALFMEVNPIPIKTAMAMRGLCGAFLRLPLCPLSPIHHQRLVQVLTHTN